MHPHPSCGSSQELEAELDQDGDKWVPSDDEDFDEEGEEEEQPEGDTQLFDDSNDVTDVASSGGDLYSTPIPPSKRPRRAVERSGARAPPSPAPSSVSGATTALAVHTQRTTPPKAEQPQPRARRAAANEQILICLICGCNSEAPGGCESGQGGRPPLE